MAYLAILAAMTLLTYKKMSYLVTGGHPRDLGGHGPAGQEGTVLHNGGEVDDRADKA